MTRKFTARVDLERRVLSLVNSHFKVPLNGLTQVAINTWGNANSLPSDEVFNLVEIIAKRARIDVDGSREVFTYDNVDVNTPTNNYIAQLKQALASRPVDVN